MRRDAGDLDKLIAMLIDDIDVAWPELRCRKPAGPDGRDDSDGVGDVRAALREARHAIARMIRTG